jgi:hypothetical protein
VVEVGSQRKIAALDRKIDERQANTCVQPPLLAVREGRSDEKPASVVVVTGGAPAFQTALPSRAMMKSVPA